MKIDKMFANDKGFTLVELLAAVVILAIIAISFSQISYFTSVSWQKVDRQSEAMRIAESELQQKRLQIADSFPPVESQNVPEKEVNGFKVVIDETPLVANPDYSTPTHSNFVTAQGVVLLTNGSAYESRLLTVIVSWED